MVRPWKMLSAAQSFAALPQRRLETPGESSISFGNASSFSVAEIHLRGY